MMILYQMACRRMCHLLISMSRDRLIVHATPRWLPAGITFLQRLRPYPVKGALALVKMCHFHMSCDAYVLFSYRRKMDMT